MSESKPKAPEKIKFCRKCVQKDHRYEKCTEKIVFRADPYKPLSDKEVLMIHVPNLKRPLTALVEFYADSDTDSDSDVEEINFE